MTRIHFGALLILAAIGALLFALPAHGTTRCRGAHGRFIKCPPPPAPTPPPPPPAPFDPETVASWVPAPATAPLAVGSYAFLTNGGPCCKGLIVKILGAGLTGDVDPARRVNVYAVQYAADPSGNYPASPYWRGLVVSNYDAGLQGVVPGP